MPHWFDDPIKCRRIHRHVRWFYLDEDSVAHGIKPPRPLPAATTSRLVAADKVLIPDVKELLGYLEKFQTWGESLDNPTVFQEFIDRMHHPTMVGSRAAIERGIAVRRERRGASTDRAELARRVLDHPRLDCEAYHSPTGGYASKGLKEIAAGGKAYVASPESADTGRHVLIDTRLLHFLLDLGDAQTRDVQVNCIVNGDHSEDSGHYLGIDVDIGTGGGRNRIETCAANNGMIVLHEDSAHDHVHPIGRP